MVPLWPLAGGLVRADAVDDSPGIKLDAACRATSSVLPAIPCGGERSPARAVSDFQEPCSDKGRGIRCL